MVATPATPAKRPATPGSPGTAIVLRCRQSTADLDMVKSRVGPNEGRIQVSQGRFGCSRSSRRACSGFPTPPKSWWSGGWRVRRSAATRLAAGLGTSLASRSHGGCADTLWTIEAQAKVVVVAQTAAIGSRTRGRRCGIRAADSFPVMPRKPTRGGREVHGSPVADRPGGVVHFLAR